MSESVRLDWSAVRRDPIGARIARAMIGFAGTRGYEATTLEAVCGRAGVDWNEFVSRFGDKEECFLDAYDEVAADFCGRVQAAYHGQVSWHDRIWAAAWEAIAFLREDPVRARFFVLEVNGAGLRAQARRDRVMQGLVEMVDAGRAELGDRAAVSRCSAEVVGGAIYSTILQKIREGSLERGEGFVVDLIYVAMLPYLGAEAAEAELRVQTLG